MFAMRGIIPSSNERKPLLYKSMRVSRRKVDYHGYVIIRVSDVFHGMPVVRIDGLNVFITGSGDYLCIR